MLYKNLAISIQDNKIISKQTGGTPGIYSIFILEPNQVYHVEFVGLEIGNRIPYFWVANMSNRNLIYQALEPMGPKQQPQREIEFMSKIRGRCKVGLLFRSARFGDHFFLEDIRLEKAKIPVIDEILPEKKLLSNEKIDEKIVDIKVDELEIIDELIKASGQNVRSFILNQNIDKNTISNSFIENRKIKLPIFENDNKRKTTIIIPCHYRHFHFIPQLLNFYEKQTIPPYQVILILCEYQKANLQLLNKMENHNYVFLFKIIKLKEKSPAGKNRYIGSQMAESEFIAFQDADDLPHPQRIEIIQYFFNMYPEIVHLCHAYTRRMNIIGKKYNLQSKNGETIGHKIINYNMFLNHREMASYPLTNGNIAIRRSIVNEIQWEKNRWRGQDVALNKNIFRIFGKFLLIRVPLYIYREQFTVKYVI